MSSGDVVTIEVVELVTGGGSHHQRTIDQDGKIWLPILGDVNASRLTRRELAEQIHSRLAERDLLRDPMVTVSLVRSDPAAVVVPGLTSDEVSEAPKDPHQLIEQLMEEIDDEN